MFEFSRNSFGRVTQILLAISTVLATGVVTAESPSSKDAAATKVAYRTETTNTTPALRLTENNELVLSAAPRECPVVNTRVRSML